MKNILIYLLTIILFFVYTTTEAKQCYCNCTIKSDYEIENNKKTSEIFKNKTKRTQGYKKIMKAARALKKEIGNLEKSQRHISSYKFRDLSLSKILN